MVGFGTNPGIVPVTCHEIFARIRNETSRQWQVGISMCELYNEKLQDLFGDVATRPKGGLKIREHKTVGVYVDGQVQQQVHSLQELEGWLAWGNRNRTIGST